MATTQLPLSLIVNVQLNVQPLAPTRRDFGAIVLLTPETGPFDLQGANFLRYSTITSLAQDFGINSQTYAAAVPFFAQSPRPTTLLVARWDAEPTQVPAHAATLFGRPVTAPVSAFSAIDAGSFTLPINGEPRDFGNINLTSATTYAQVATTVNGAISSYGVTCTWDSVGTRFLIASSTPGAATQVGFVTGAGAGFIGTLMGLDDVSPTNVVPGTDASEVDAQTIPEALQSLSSSYGNWYAATVAKSPLTDDEISTTTDFIMASDRKIFGVTSMNQAHLSQQQTNVFKRLYDDGAYRVAAQFDTQEPYAIMSFLARALAVNFAGSNTTLTMKFKTLPTIAAMPITEQQAAAASALGLNYYTYFDTVAMVAEGTVIGGRFFDEVHILDWFCDAVQKNVFAILYQSPTKVPLTDAGTHRLIAGVEQACQQGIVNGAFAPGVWNGDPFGVLETGAYLDRGYYIYADTVDNLSPSDRQQRRAPPIQVALKLAGAIHHADIIVNFDR